MKQPGIVYLVGAGPGDPGLLTLRGAELLGRAEVVVYDALVNPELLRLAPPTAEIVYGGKRSGNHSIPQTDLNELLVHKAQQGKIVVRLKGGDPYVFGRGGEEAEELSAAGIKFEVVPGISSTVAAPNYAGIPVTHREHCSSYLVVTGHEDPEKGETDWDSIARAPGTKVILMGADNIARIAERLIGQGMAPETPVAMVRWGTTSRQQSISATLESIGALAAQHQFSAPVVTIIGDVVQLRNRLNWYETRPLFGQRMVVTRSRDQASELSRRLNDLGAEVVELPTIKIVPPQNKQDLKDALLTLNAYDWIVFTSPNGVTAFFDYFFKGFDDMRDLGGARFVAVGPATAAKLKELHIKVELMPETALSQKIADAFANYQSIENQTVLLLRAEVANPDLPIALEKLGAIVDDVPCYRTEAETDDRTGAAARLLEEGADWITFTSSSTVENFNRRIGLLELTRKFPKLKLASIGPETTKALVSLGLKPTVEAQDRNIPGLVRAVVAYATAIPVAS